MTQSASHHQLDDNEAPSLGPCCICECTEGVTNILMLDRRAIVSGHGWGCLECGLPPDGAVAVLCNTCIDFYRADPAALRFACRGYPAIEGRIAIAELPPGTFEHDAARHAAEVLGIDLGVAADPAEAEQRDLSELIPEQAFNHKDCFHSTHYDRWEREIATPILRSQGYEVLRWFSQDSDSFGPLVRAVELRKDGKTETYFYG